MACEPQERISLKTTEFKAASDASSAEIRHHSRRIECESSHRIIEYPRAADTALYVPHADAQHTGGKPDGAEKPAAKWCEGATHNGPSGIKACHGLAFHVRTAAMLCFRRLNSL